MSTDHDLRPASRRSTGGQVALLPNPLPAVALAVPIAVPAAVRLAERWPAQTGLPTAGQVVSSGG